MAQPQLTEQHCPTCGTVSPIAFNVCPHCRTILLSHRRRKATPPWVIALLLVLILAAASYAVYLAHQILVLHRF
jgi:predicted nucleic acid-binding Zn ribbon protein